LIAFTCYVICLKHFNECWIKSRLCDAKSNEYKAYRTLCRP
jgi:hypothetical protein